MQTFILLRVHNYCFSKLHYFFIAVVHSEGSLVLDFVCSLFQNFRVSQCEDYMTEYEWLSSHVCGNADCTCQFIITVLLSLSRKFLYVSLTDNNVVERCPAWVQVVGPSSSCGSGRLDREFLFYFNTFKFNILIIIYVDLNF